MNDDELITAVKESVTDVHMTIPAEQIVSRSRAIRTRRRIPVLAGTLAVAAATVLAVTTLLPGNHHPSRQPSARLAAWTVTTQPGGNVSVTIRELHNPAGLQRRLRADGVAASVTFLGQQNPACQPWPGAALQGMSTPAGTALFNKVFPPTPPGAPPGVIVIHPSALPRSGGVQLAAGFRQSGPPHSWYIAIGAGLVRASPRCTGS
jgi:hypothetical protein